MSRWLAIIFLLIAFCSKGQNDKSQFNIGDTIVASFHFKGVPDSVITEEYFLAEEVSAIGISLEVGLSYFIYNRQYNSWISNHISPYFGIGLIYNRLIFGARYRPWTLNTKDDIIIGSDTLPKNTLLNANKNELYLGYQFYKSEKYQIHFYTGSVIESYYIHDKNELHLKSTLPRLKGYLIGFNISRDFYSRIGYCSIFMNSSYQLTNYGKLKDSFGIGNMQFTIGVSASIKPTRKYWQQTKN